MATLPYLLPDGESIKIWSHIFRKGDWLEEILEISKSALHLPIPLLLGADLKRVAEGNTEGCYLSLLLQDWTGDSRYCKDLFRESLQDHTCEDEAKNEIFLVDSKITLHIGDVLTDNEEIKIQDPRKLFEDELYDESFFSFAMYYGGEKITKIKNNKIRGIEGKARREKKFVAELCHVRLESRLRTPLWRCLSPSIDRQMWFAPIRAASQLHLERECLETWWRRLEKNHITTS